jgi:hypothetical protein
VFFGLCLLDRLDSKWIYSENRFAAFLKLIALEIVLPKN